MTCRVSRALRVSSSLWCVLVAGGATVVGACGGIAVIDDGEGGGGGASASTVGSVSVTTTTTTAAGGAPTVSVSSSTTSGSTGGAPSIPPLVETEFGVVAPGMALPVMVPSNAVGVTGYTESVGLDGLVRIDEVIAPDGFFVVAGAAVPGGNATFERPQIVTAAVPQTDDAQAIPLQPGVWTFVPGGAADSASVWYRQTLDGAFHGGAIDVNVFRVPTAASDGYVNQIVSSALEGFAGLTVGTVRNFSLPSVFSVVDETNAFALFLETENAPGRPVLNVMVVDLIDFGEVQPLGFSPGVPGNPLVNGSFQSAVVMLPTGDADIDTTTLRHEAGHFVGLSHTSEQEIGVHDRLGDTPECADVLGINIGCPDVDNLMFPFAIPGSLRELSSLQAAVIRASAVYRGAVAPGGGFAEPLDGSMRVRPAPVVPPPDGADDDGRAVAAWRDLRLAPEAERLLGAHWCTKAHIDDGALVRTYADAATLLQVGRDETAPPFIRGRAIRYAARSGELDSGDLDRIAVIAANPSAPRGARLGAVLGLRDVAPGRLSGLGLGADRDPVVARVAVRR
ncbi:MAG: hypothetical protein AAF715_00430 [Myxococcota bacterium]